MRKDWLAWFLLALIAVAASALAWVLFAGQVLPLPWAALGLLLAYAALFLVAGQVRAARHRRRYLRALVDRYSDLERPFSLPLERVYVELRLAPLLRRAIPADPDRFLAATVPPGGTAIWAYLWPGQVESQGLTIVGPAGSGKTTLLKHIVLTLAGDRDTRQAVNAPDRLPVLLSVQDYAPTSEQADASSHNALARLIWTQLSSPGSAIPERWFERQLRQGRCLVMLDGFDQVADPAALEQIAAWIEAQMARYPRCHFMVAAPTPDHRRGPLRRTTALKICPLVSEQIEAFASRWYRASEREGGPAAGKAAERAADLVRQVQRDRTLSALAADPLLLALLCVVHRHGHALPTRRAEVYAAACDVFLRGQAGQPGVERTPIQVRRSLQALAFHMMHRRRCELPLAEAAEVMRVDTAEAIRASGGLLARHGSAPAACRFAHLEFQAYLAAAHAEAAGLAAHLVERVDDTWWHETIRFYAGQSDAAPVVGACLAQDPPSIGALHLATDCVREASVLSPQTRARFEAVLRAGAEDADPERCRIAAQALLALRLDRMARLDEQRYADDGLITHAEYQRFLDERRVQGQYHQPDHWLEYRFSPGQGSTPVVGMRPPDAAAFCEWLTQRETGPWQYRLPRAGELEWRDGYDAGYWVLQGGDDSAARVDASPEIAGGGLEQYVVLVLARDLGRAHSRDHDLDRARTIALARASDLVTAPTRVAASASDLDRALSRARASDVTLARARDVALVHVIDRTIQLARDRPPTGGLDLSRVHAFATLGEQRSAVDHDLSADIASAVDRARERVIDRAIDRILSSIVALDLARSIASAGDLARASDRAHDLRSTLEGARTRAGDFARGRTGGAPHVADLARHLARDIAQASDLAHGLTGDLARKVDGTLAIAGDQAEASELARAIDLHTVIARAREVSLTRAIDLASAGDFGVASDMTHSLALDLDMARARASDLVGHLPAARNAGDLVHALSTANAAVRDLALAFALASDLDSDMAIASALTRASEQMPTISSDYRQIVQSWRWHVRMQTLALAVRLYHQSPGQDTQQWCDACLDLYVDLAILEGRIQGDLPAFEGIRLVRERLEPSIPSST